MYCDEIEQVIKEYLDNPKSEYAVMIDGEWGVGKTYFLTHSLMKIMETIDNGNIAKGNTLSAVFAMQEATKYNNFDNYERNSNVKALSSGIQSYYEYIWKGAIKQAKDIGYTIDMYLAAVFSIINRKISADYISKIFDKDISVWQWEDILQNLFPIIEYDKFGYSVFHNDVKSSS